MKEYEILIRGRQYVFREDANGRCVDASQDESPLKPVPDALWKYLRVLLDRPGQELDGEELRRLANASAESSTNTSNTLYRLRNWLDLDHPHLGRGRRSDTWRLVGSGVIDVGEELTRALAIDPGPKAMDALVALHRGMDRLNDMLDVDVVRFEAELPVHASGRLDYLARYSIEATAKQELPRLELVLGTCTGCEPDDVKRFSASDELAPDHVLRVRPGQQLGPLLTFHIAPSERVFAGQRIHWSWTFSAAGALAADRAQVDMFLCWPYPSLRRVEFDLAFRVPLVRGDLYRVRRSGRVEFLRGATPVDGTRLAGEVDVEQDDAFLVLQYVPRT